MSDYPTSSSSKPYKKKVFKKITGQRNPSEAECHSEKQADTKRPKLKPREKSDAKSQEIVADRKDKSLKVCEEVSVTSRTLPRLSLTDRTSLLHENALDKSKRSDNLGTEIRFPTSYINSSECQANSDGIYSDWYPDDTHQSSIDSMLLEQSNVSLSSRTDQSNMHMNSNQKTTKNTRNRRQDSTVTNSELHPHLRDRQQSGDESGTISGETFLDAARVLLSPTIADTINTSGRQLRYSGNNIQVYTPAVNNDNRIIRRVPSDEQQLPGGVIQRGVYSEKQTNRVGQPLGFGLQSAGAEDRNTVVTTQPTQVSTCCGRMEITNTVQIKYLPCACNANITDHHGCSQMNKYSTNAGIQTVHTGMQQPNVSSQYSKSLRSEQQSFIHEQVSYVDDKQLSTATVFPRLSDCDDGTGRRVATAKTTTSIRSMQHPSDLPAYGIVHTLSTVENDPQTISEVNDSDFTLVRNEEDFLHSNDDDEDDLPRPSYCCFRRRKKIRPTTGTASSISTIRPSMPISVQQERTILRHQDSALLSKSVVHTNKVEAITELSEGKKTDIYRRIQERREEFPIPVVVQPSISHCSTRASTQQSLHQRIQTDSDTEPPDAALFSYPSHQFNSPVSQNADKSETRFVNPTTHPKFQPIIIKRVDSDRTTDNPYPDERRQQATSVPTEPPMDRQTPAWRPCACQTCCPVGEQNYVHQVYAGQPPTVPTPSEGTAMGMAACIQASCPVMRQCWCQYSLYNNVCYPGGFQPCNCCFRPPVMSCCYCAAMPASLPRQAFTSMNRYGPSRALMT